VSVAAYLDFARTLPEPMLLVAGDGTIAGANSAAAELLGRPAETLTGVPFSSLTTDAAAETDSYLRACARGRFLVPGAFTVRGAAGATFRCRCDGGLLCAGPPDESLVLLRLRYADAASTRFVLLNQQIEELSREVDERRRVEAERLELLTRARSAQQELEREREALVRARDALLDRTRDLERARERLERLQAATAALCGALTPAQVASVVLEHCVAALAATAVSTLLLDDDGTTLELVRYLGYPADFMRRWQAIPITSPVPVAHAARTGEAVFIESEAQWHAQFGEANVPRILPATRSWAALPLWVEDKPLGAIGMSFEREGPFSPDDRAFMLALAQQSAQALERARLFAAAERARGEAEAANRAKLEFLATMSHELRTPLNAIAGYAELLELEIRGPVTNLQRDDLRRIRRSQQHLLSLVNDVLNFARIETGDVRFRFEDVPLDDALCDMETLVAPLLEARRLHYEHVCLANGARVRVDRDKMQQVVLNLLTNAVKFTDPGGRVTLTAHVDGDRARVSVADTGRGIPADKLEQIFEPFVQIERGLTRTRDGAGLGLAISRELAVAMGGDLAATSEPGRGSTFTLIVPLATPSGDGALTYSPTANRGADRVERA
jgi:signal transduction histidine kinase